MEVAIECFFYFYFWVIEGKGHSTCGSVDARASELSWARVFGCDASLGEKIVSKFFGLCRRSVMGASRFADAVVATTCVYRNRV